MSGSGVNEASFGDDYAKQMQVLYPAIVFENVEKDDQVLLKPIFIALHALAIGMGQAGNTNIVFQPIVFDREAREYTMAGDFSPETRLSYRALSALWTVNPTRIRSMRLEPYFKRSESGGHKIMLRLIVKVLSLTSHKVPCSFELYLKSNKTLLRPGLSHNLAAELPVTKEALKEEADLIKSLEQACRTMTLDKSVMPELTDSEPYSFKDNFITQRNITGSATVRWQLPAGGGIDVMSSHTIWLHIGPRVDDICYGMHVSTPPSRQGHEAPLVRLFVDVYLFSPSSSTLQLTDSRVQLFYTDESVMTEPWRFEVSGPSVMAPPASAAATSIPRLPRKNQATSAQSKAKLLLANESKKRERTELRPEEYHQEVIEGEHRGHSLSEEEEDRDDGGLLEGDIVEMDTKGTHAMVVYERPSKRARHTSSNGRGGMMSRFTSMVSGFFLPPDTHRSRLKHHHRDESSSPSSEQD